MDAADKVYDVVQQAGLEIDLLVNNAGFGTHGVFGELDLERELDMINLSYRLPVALTHKFIGGMQQRNRGAIVFLASMAGTMPIPFMSTRSATKTFPRLSERVCTASWPALALTYWPSHRETPARSFAKQPTSTTHFPSPPGRQTR